MYMNFTRWYDGVAESSAMGASNSEVSISQVNADQDINDDHYDSRGVEHQLGQGENDSSENRKDDGHDKRDNISESKDSDKVYDTIKNTRVKDKRKASEEPLSSEAQAEVERNPGETSNVRIHPSPLIPQPPRGRTIAGRFPLSLIDRNNQPDERTILERSAQTNSQFIENPRKWRKILKDLNNNNK